MSISREAVVHENFRAFQNVVGALLPSEEGKYALMRNGEVGGIYQDLIDAVAAGHSRFEDGVFSIQKVTTKPLDLGFYSHANPSGPIC
jgi:hypothetical protein